ncbi:MAG: SAM-dependent methyltransferase [Burkholderiales bacterium]|nr:SAM-dependent methyltransferase [Burkholderiales bacterium]
MRAQPTPPPKRLAQRLQEAIGESGGWLPFDRFMAIALYEPGLGYYTRGDTQIGRWPADGPGAAGGGAGSDFVTAPELSPLFGRALAVQLAQALDATGTDEVWEFGAGTGALAEQLLVALGERVRRYLIVDLSGALATRQRARLARFGDRVHWVSALPERIDGVVVGNELLDAMPVQLLHWDGASWFERGVALAAEADAAGAPRFAWSDRPTALRPPVAGPFAPGTVTEIHPQAQAFVRTLAATLGRGAAFFVDYGFPESEYYHPQRIAGTLMCHRAHCADADPLAEVGDKDITAHVDFTAIALAAQDAGMEVLGYTAQARFLINCGLPGLLAEADLPARAAARRLIDEHEMGELFKVIGLAKGAVFDAVGFSAGDRSHRL